MTTPTNSKELSGDQTLEADPRERVAAFQSMLCNACQIQNAGICVKDSGECPVDTVGRAYQRAS